MYIFFNYIKKLIFVLIFFTGVKYYSQDTAFLLNGKKFEGKLVYEDNWNIALNIPKPMRPKNLKFFNKEEMFSIIDKKGNERVFYQQNKLMGYPFNVDEMRSWANGSNHAINTFDSNKYFWWGAGINLVGSFLLTYKFETGTAYSKPFRFWPHVVLVGATPTTLEATQLGLNNPDAHKYVKDPYFHEGYSETALEKIRIKAFKGTCVGFGLATILYFTFN